MAEIINFLQEVPKSKKSKEILGKRNDFIINLLQASPSFFIVIDSEGKILFMNDPILKALGYTLEEVVSKDYFSTLVQEPYFLKNSNNFEKMLNSKRIPFDENRLITKDGRELFVKWNIHPVLKKNSELEYFFGVGIDITEKKLAEKALKENMAQYRILAENLTDVIWTMDLHMRFSFLSPSITRLLGYSVKEAMSLPLEKLLPPSSMKVVQSTMVEEMANEKSDQKDLYRTRILEIELYCKHGSKVWTENKVKFFYDQNNNPIGILGVTRDIDDRKQKENALSEHENILHTLLQETPSTIIVLDCTGRYIDVNKAALEFFECNKENLIGKTFWEFAPPYSMNKWKKEYQKFVDKKIVEMDFLVHGRIKTLFLSMISITTSEKNVCYCIGHDITQRKQAEKSLKESEERYRIIMENQTDLVVKTHPDGRFLFVSPSYCELFGKSEEELLGKRFIPKIHKDDSEATVKAMEELCTFPYTCYIEQRTLTKYGWKWLAWSNKAICSDDGNIEAIVSVAREITERKESEQEKEKMYSQVLQSQKMEAVGTLAGGIAHDFNNLLMVIKGYSDFLSEKIPQGSPMKDDIKEIKKAVERASSLTTQLLTFSRRQNIQPKLLDLNTLVSDLEKMLRRLIGEDIHLKSILDPDLKHVKADQAQLDQVIMNLAINARDSMPHGGALYIKTENVALDQVHIKFIPEAQPGPYVCLSILDTGTGMEKETLQHIFEPFFTTKRYRNGTGLGLSIVYGIVKEHRGWINVYSDPGRGTTFNIYFPAFSMNQDTEVKKVFSLKAFQGNSEKILLVEDEKDVRNFIKKALHINGYVVFEASNTQDALEIFNKEGENFDLIFSDVILSDGTGIQLAEQLITRKPKLRVLLSSGYTEQKSRWSIISEKGFGFLQKPYELADLLTRIKDELTKTKEKKKKKN